MRVDIRNEWVDDLMASPPQAQGMLTKIVDGKEAGDCCLGRLCKLAVHYGVIPEPQPCDISGDPVESWDDACALLYGRGNNFSSAALPDAVVEWAELEDSDPDRLGPDRSEYYLADLNDQYGYTFREIAAIVRDCF